MKIKGFGKTYEVEPSNGKYAYGDTLAVSLNCKIDSHWEPYGNLTVKLGDKNESDTRAYVDINNMPQAEVFINEYGLGKFTGIVGHSGFCDYPLYEFYLDRI